MKSKLFGWSEIGLVAAAVLLNAAVLTQTVSGPSMDLSATAFAQPYQLGDPCTDPSECESGFCVDGVCCGGPCDAPGQACNPQGLCVSEAQAPVMSLPFQWLAAGLVALVTMFRLRRRWLNG